MLIPSRRLLQLIVALLIAAIAAAIEPRLNPVWQAGGALVLIVAVIDALAAVQPWPLAGQRRAPGSLPLGVWHTLALRVVNRGRQTMVLAVFDHHPDGFEARGLPQTVTVRGGGWVDISYDIRPVRRGELRFGMIEARVTSAFGFWQRTLLLGTPTAVRVYPNFAALTKYALLAIDNRLSQIGILQRRRRGEGLEFHQLREYREGDTLRQIDWKATSRTTRLISREYQDERDQQILFLIDCGRRLSAQDGELSHFDYVLNAALLLAYVSLRQGDAVGFMTMSTERQRYLSPRKSAATVNLILNRVYDLQPSLLTPDYYGAAVELMLRLKKRALVVILSNLRDEDDDTLLPALGLLGRRHLVLFASLRENILSRALTARVDSFDRALTHAAAADYLRVRELAFRRLEHCGALCLDVEPEQLPVALVNRYLDIKSGGRL
jgi:uncharacterized protein (DUF58 family)